MLLAMTGFATFYGFIKVYAAVLQTADEEYSKDC